MFRDLTVQLEALACLCGPEPPALFPLFLSFLFFLFFLVLSLFPSLSYSLSLSLFLLNGKVSGSGLFVEPGQIFSSERERERSQKETHTHTYTQRERREEMYWREKRKWERFLHCNRFTCCQTKEEEEGKEEEEEEEEEEMAEYIREKMLLLLLTPPLSSIHPFIRPGLLTTIRGLLAVEPRFLSIFSLSLSLSLSF